MGKHAFNVQQIPFPVMKAVPSHGTLKNVVALNTL